MICGNMKILKSKNNITFNDKKKIDLFYFKKKTDTCTVNKYVEAISHTIKDELLKKISDFLSKASPMPIKSEQLMRLGFQGAKLGAVIQKLETEWVKSDFTKTNDELLKLV